jgi:hypothetical protein
MSWVQRPSNSSINKKFNYSIGTSRIHSLDCIILSIDNDNYSAPNGDNDAQNGPPLHVFHAIEHPLNLNELHSSG